MDEPVPLEALLPGHGRFFGRVHALPVRVYYEDTDFSGMVYHANYVRFCERGRSAFLRAAGIAHEQLLARAEPVLFAVTKLSLQFHQAARIDDALVVRTCYECVRGARLLIVQEVWRGTIRLVSAEVEACCINSAGRAIRPPADFVAVLAPWFRPEPGPAREIVRSTAHGNAVVEGIKGETRP